MNRYEEAFHYIAELVSDAGSSGVRITSYRAPEKGTEEHVLVVSSGSRVSTTRYVLPDRYHGSIAERHRQGVVVKGEWVGESDALTRVFEKMRPPGSLPFGADHSACPRCTAPLGLCPRCHEDLLAGSCFGNVICMSCGVVTPDGKLDEGTGL